MGIKDLCIKCGQPEFYHRFNQKSKKVEKVQWVAKPQRYRKRGSVPTEGIICSKCCHRLSQISL